MKAYQTTQEKNVDFYGNQEQLEENCDNMIKAFLFDKRNSTSTNAKKLKKAQRELTHTKKAN